MPERPAGPQQTIARRGHVVICGDTQLSVAVARQQSRKSRVTLAGAPEAALDSVQIVDAADDPDVLLRRTDACRANLVFIDRRDDTKTLAVLHALLEAHARGGPLPRVVAHVRDPALRRAVLGNIEAAAIAPRPQIVSAAAALAEEVIDRERLFDVAHWRDQPGVHVLILGFSQLGRACFGESIAAGIAGALAPPHVTILDRDPAAVRSVIERDMPEIGRSTHVVIEAFGLDSRLLAAIEKERPLTAIFICLEDEAESIAAMLALAHLQQHADQMLASVHLLAEDARPAGVLARPRSSDGDIGRRFTVDAGLRDDRDLIDLLTVRDDATARRLHEAYRRRFDSASGSSADWDALPETYRDANRRAARHLQQKLWTAGLTEPARSGEPADVDPAAYASIVVPCASSRSEDALGRLLSRLEHERWCAERRLDGWRYGPARDDRLRLHPKLVSFDDPSFTDAEIAKDADQVRLLFREVARSVEGGATAPMVVGIATGAKGVDVAGATETIERETWRPIVLVCALVEAAEIMTAQTLIENLERLQRPFRLATPEIAPDNAPLRRLPDDARKALGALLALPATRIIPIASKPPDPWVDPAAPDRDLERIARYVAARASVLIDPGRRT